MDVTSDRQRLVDRIRSHRTGTAIVHGGRAVSYPELTALVDERAGELRAFGAGGALVAVERPKSIGFLVDYLAVLAVGGVVVPVDPDTPPERRATFLELTRPDLLLTGRGRAPLDGDPDRRLPADGAFVYFTSGSTGVPKPVLGSARAVLGFADWFCGRFGFGPGDRFAFLAGLSFEASLRDVVPALWSGATLVIPDAGPEDAVEWLAGNAITVVTAVPSVARAWLRAARTTGPAVRAVFFVGEPLTADVLAAWSRTFPNTGVRVNSYGSTESGQATIYRQIGAGEEDLRPVPAGRPVPGTRFCFVEPGDRLTADLVRDRLDHPVDRGEIVIVSRSCSHGYLGMPAENAGRFADLGDGERAYRTGDLGRTDATGQLVVIGRADDEVKINGVRVHPAEVTRVLGGRAGVADAFVLADRDASGAARLTGYLVSAGGLSIPDLRRDLLDVLPAAMIPARFVEVGGFPTTRTGKVDRAALVRLAEESPLLPAYVAPDGEVECWLADRFTELTGAERVGADDDLFALGGDSITATRLAARIHRDLGVELSQRDVFATATVARLADEILERQLAAVDPAELAALLAELENEGRP